jgi:hypothetical protein
MDAKTLFAPRPLQRSLVPLLNEWLLPERTALALDYLRAGTVPISVRASIAVVDNNGRLF